MRLQHLSGIRSAVSMDLLLGNECYTYSKNLSNCSPDEEQVLRRQCSLVALEICLEIRLCQLIIQRAIRKVIRVRPVDLEDRGWKI